MTGLLIAAMECCMPKEAVLAAFGQDLPSPAPSGDNPGDPVITRSTVFNSDHVWLLQYLF